LPLRQDSLVLQTRRSAAAGRFCFRRGFIFVALPQAIAALSPQKVIGFSDAIIDFFAFMME
jgi:hypothetical protein